jgi:hypothetical protein
VVTVVGYGTANMVETGQLLQVFRMGEPTNSTGVVYYVVALLGYAVDIHGVYSTLLSVAGDIVAGDIMGCVRPSRGSIMMIIGRC